MYGVLVWWKAIDMETYKKTLEKVLKLTERRITRVINYFVPELKKLKNTQSIQPPWLSQCTAQLNRGSQSTD